MKKDIKVSIFCLTYNHKEYIRDAINGFLEQRTNFKFEIFIYDDASTDGTSQIVREYETRFPDIIKAYICEENTYNRVDVKEIRSEIKENLNGKYIALCEGDDYWIDPYKLQIQVDYMEKHEDCSLYMHNSIWWNYDNNLVYAGNPFCSINSVANISVKELILQDNGHPATASFLYKRSDEHMPPLFYRTSVGDYSLQLYLATRGKVMYDSRIMSVYRWHIPGSYNSRTLVDEEHMLFFILGLVNLLLNFDIYTEYQNHSIILDKIQRILSGLLEKLNVKKKMMEYIAESNRVKNFDCCKSLEFIQMVEQLKKQILDLAYCSELMKEYCQKHKKIWIMGTGRYSVIVTKQLLNKKIKIEGYTISKSIEKDTKFMNQIVVNIKDMPKNEYIGVIVAINPINHLELRNSLKNAGVSDYYNPFDFDWRLNQG